MKNLTILVLAFSLVNMDVFGQTPTNNNRNKLMFGFRVGGNYSNIYDTKSEQFSAEGKYGSAVGLFVAIPISETIGIQPEIMYSQKGFKATGELLSIPYTFTRLSEYIDVPLLLTIKPAEFLSILVGPQLSFLTKKKDTFTTSINSVVREETFNNDKLRKNTLGLTGGLDFNFNPLVIGTRVGYDLQNNNGDGTASKPRYKNANYQATIGFRF